MNRNRAFTLVELLIVILITGLIMGSVLTLTFSVFKSYEIHQDTAEAKQRGQIALAAIQPFVLNAGLGLPNTTLEFQTAFSGLTPLLPVQVNRKFKGFVQLATGATEVADDTVTSAPALWLVYSVPSGAGVNEEYSVPNNPAAPFFNIKVEQFAALDQASNLSTSVEQLKSWVSFPSASSPFRVRTINTFSGELNVDSAYDQWIASFDEIHFVRAVKIYVGGSSNLIIDHLDGSGAQSVLDGIVGIWCSFDSDGDRVLTVRVLARAGTKRTDIQQVVIEGWPEGATPLKASLDPSYRYAVVSRSWRMRN